MSQKSLSKKKLSKVLIIEKSLQLIEQQGLEKFSLRKLAETLDCKAMSIYNHFPNKAHIFDALVDHLLAGIAIPDAAIHGEGLTPVQRLREIAMQWREMALKHPSFYSYLCLHRLNSPTGLRFMDGVLNIINDAGMEAEKAARLFRVINYFLIGAGLDESKGYAKGHSYHQPPTSEEIAKQYPGFSKAKQYFSEDDFLETFEFGLELLLKSIE